MDARFQADETFVIQKRGLVLSGRLIEGKIEKDMIVSIPFFARPLKIEEIDIIHAVNVPAGLMGLIFALVDDQDSALWKALDVKGKIFEIEGNSAEYA